MNKELKIKKIDELIKELNEYKTAIESDITYFEAKKLDKLMYDKDKDVSELFNWKSKKIKIEYAEFKEDTKETILMSNDKNFFAKETIDGYEIIDSEGNIIIHPLDILSYFIIEVEKIFIIENKYIIELCKLNSNRDIIINFMKDYDYDSIDESPGDIRFDFDCNYISFKYDNEEIEVIDPSLELFHKFKKVCPQAVLSSIKPLCF
ncbi:hypothetical protein ACFO6R_01325 [Eubacterium multiforme]|uniref:DUF3298 domain-containing protein n=1 Tax=Eubacterium multiforme TaxID=83339 RepID=A0ABT9UPP0_9FIRM|nr:hypothetical protein [Eubacterium multiforme]MDQ0148611.1 hypothetical protein [Eubacterium multiforme]